MEEAVGGTEVLRTVSAQIDPSSRETLMRAYILLVLAAIPLNSSLLGAEEKDDATTTAPAPQARQDRAIASAFALPKETVLNAKQQTAYDSLKQAKEGDLRQALNAVQQTKGADSAKALKTVRELRTEIRSSIQDILAMPYREAAEKSQSRSAKYVPGVGVPYQPNYYPLNYYPSSPDYYYPYYSRPYGGYYYYRPTNSTTSTTSSKPTTTSKPQFTTTSKPANTKTTKH
jgi:hypothetical protein